MAQKNRRVFLQSIAALPMLTAHDPTRPAPNSSQTGRPPIQFDFAANFDKDDIYRFLDGQTTKWDAPLVLPRLYSPSSVPKKAVGSIDKYPDDIQGALVGKAIRLWWARQKKCRVQQGAGQGQFVGSSEVVIPCSWQVTIQIFAVLLMKNDGSVPASARQTIETAFTNFQYPRDGDPLSFIQKAINNDPTLSTDYFSVINTFTLTKVPNAFISKNDQESAFKNGGTVWTGPNSQMPMQKYFEEKEINLVCSERAEFLGRIPEPRPDPHIVEIKDGNKKDAVEGIANNDTPPACKDLKENDWPLLTIDFWPEFQVVMKDCSIDIGCGIHIVLTLPVLQMRISGHDLWVYTKYPKSWSVIDTVVQQCAFEAGLEGAVVGVVLWNFGAGLAAFLGAFQDCINRHVQNTIECMVPGLALLISVKKDWFDVL
jgi:hypothetical protein